MPKVSVIMGIYNCADFMGPSIQSIINQTFTDWEFIMCDDGSSDNTYEVACEYAKKDPRIKVIKNERNMRLAYTLNHCLEVAQGEYIARMDADDISYPERFEKQVAFLDDNPEYALVASGATIFDETGERLTRGLGDPYTLQNPVEHTIPIIHPSVMMQKSAYDLLNGYTVSPETARAEDLDLWYRFRLSGLKGYVLQENLIKVRERAVDFKRRTVKAAVGMVKLNKKYYKLLKVPCRYRPLAYKPLISALLPNWFMVWYHSKR